MKVICFNVNGIRARLHQLEALIEHHSPDIIGLQETKVSDEVFPHEAIERLGYRAYIHGQKSHYGVALLAKQPLNDVQTGLPDNEALNQQCRLISAEFASPSGQSVTIINGYFPQGESRHHTTKFPYKQEFYQSLTQYIQQNFDHNQALIVLGDFNICQSELDIGISAANQARWLKNGSCSFLPEEQEWYQKLMDWGLYDTYRHLFSDKNDQFSWFDYRSRGFEQEPKRGLRIDHILATAPLLQRCTDAGIDYETRAMEKPSDHCPIWATFDV